MVLASRHFTHFLFEITFLVPVGCLLHGRDFDFVDCALA